MASLGRISAFLADVRGASTEVSLKLTHACVQPHLEFGFPVWCVMTFEATIKLDRAQRQSLL